MKTLTDSEVIELLKAKVWGCGKNVAKRIVECLEAERLKVVKASAASSNHAESVRCMSIVFDDIAALVDLPKEQYGDPDALMDAIESLKKKAALSAIPNPTEQARGIAALGEDAIRFTDDGKRKHNSIEAFFQSEVKSSKDGGFGSVCIEVYGYGNDRDEAEEALLANYRALMEATNNQNTAGVINVKGEG